MNKLVEIFYDIDDFCSVFIPQWEKQLIADGSIKRNRSCRMAMSEVMTIVIAFHMSNHRDFKNYYKGYINKKLTASLKEKGIDLITNVRSNMKAKAMSLWDRAMLSKRFIIKTINAQLKNISQIEHSRHRSLNGFMLNLIAGLVLIV